MITNNSELEILKRCFPEFEDKCNVGDITNAIHEKLKNSWLEESVKLEATDFLKVVYSETKRHLDKINWWIKYIEDSFIDIEKMIESIDENTPYDVIACKDTFITYNWYKMGNINEQWKNIILSVPSKHTKITEATLKFFDDDGKLYKELPIKYHVWTAKEK